MYGAEQGEAPDLTSLLCAAISSPSVTISTHVMHPPGNPDQNLLQRHKLDCYPQPGCDQTLQAIMS